MKWRNMAMVAAAAVGLFAVGAVIAADAVEPAQATVVSVRDEGVAYINSTEYYRGTTLLLTNCAVYSGTTTNTARQGLDGVSIELKWGSASTNATFAGTVQSTNGLWWASFTIPTNWEAPNLQIKLTDSVSTNVYIYPWKLVHTKAGM
jgi:hypothetical protein